MNTQTQNNGIASLKSIPDWIKPSYLRLVKEYNTLIKYNVDKNKSYNNLLKHKSEGTYPKWMKTINYKPQQCKKLEVNYTFDWDLFNKTHNDKILDELINQYKLELETSEHALKLDVLSSKFKEELKENFKECFGVLNEENEKILSREEIQQFNDEFNATWKLFEDFYKSKIIKLNMKALEQKRKEAEKARKAIQKETLETDMDCNVKSLVADLVQKEVKKILKKNPNPKPKPKPKPKPQPQNQTSKPKPKNSTNNKPKPKPSKPGTSKPLNSKQNSKQNSKKQTGNKSKN